MKPLSTGSSHQECRKSIQGEMTMDSNDQNLTLEEWRKLSQWPFQSTLPLAKEGEKGVETENEIITRYEYCKEKFTKMVQNTRH